MTTNLTHIWSTKVGIILLWCALVVTVSFGLVSLTRILLYIFSWRALLRRQTVTLELTPPAFTVRSAESTKQLFSILHGLRSSRPFKDKLLKREIVLALEIVSSRERGIRYMIRVDKRYMAAVGHAITAYLPNVKISEAADLPIKEEANAMVAEYKQQEHYALPLSEHDSLDLHDPVAYLTTTMTELKPQEMIRLQLVLTPAKLKRAGILTYKALNNEDMLAQLGHRSFLMRLSYYLNSLLFNFTDLLRDAVFTSKGQNYLSLERDLHDKKQVASRKKPARRLSQIEQELLSSIHYKVSQPLFRVSLRAVVVTDDKTEAERRLGSITSSLASYALAPYQAFKPRRTLGMTRYRLFLFNNHLPAFLTKHSCVLSASEVASLYHFPIRENQQTDNLITSLSRTLPAPVSLKNGTELDVLLGENQHHGTTTPIGLTAAERERHVYIIGGTGNGKTTMLLYSIVQDMKNGKGVAVVDPHGDLSETLLRHVPENRVKDVIYLNPDDLMHPIGINLLELKPGLSGDELLREKDLITEATISVMRKIFSDDDSGGHRIEYILRNTIQTALTLEGPTLFTIFDLLNDTKYRRKVVKSIQDKDLKNFWNNELGKAGEFQKVKMAAGITAKIGRFLFSASAKRILEQPRSTIDFDDILSSGKILICNFSKGLIGEDTSTLFGTTILAKLQTAALRRARLSTENRRDYYLYVDEFQNFATIAFVQMLSEARKYRLFLTMAEQSTAQQDQQRLVDIILANVGTVICFRSGSPADERLILPLFTPFINQGEIANLPTYSFYMRIAAVQAQEPLSGSTVLLDDAGSAGVAQQVIAYSRAAYTVKPTEAPRGAEGDGVASIPPVKPGSISSEVPLM